MFGVKSDLVIVSMAKHSLLCPNVETRAQLSKGASAEPVYEMVRCAILTRSSSGGTLLDVGCGTGSLRTALQLRFARYIGCDIVRYDSFPHDTEFMQADLDDGRVPLPDGFADVVTALETIEHLENPRRFVRELVRLARPGGLVLVTTPNQLSLLSKLTLLLKNEFNAFQDGCYPAHLTALLEVDLRRIAAECRLEEVAVSYSKQGRIPGTAWHYPNWLSRCFPRALSDNILLIGRKRG